MTDPKPMTSAEIRQLKNSRSALHPSQVARLIHMIENGLAPAEPVVERPAVKKDPKPPAAPDKEGDPSSA